MTGKVHDPEPASPASLWHRAWRRPWFKRSFYELLGALLLSRKGFAVLNCGYYDTAYPNISVAGDYEADRLGLQLYHRLVRDVPLAGRDVFEVGCGRGGGAAFLSDQFKPRSYVATDVSFLMIAAAKLKWRRPHLRFAQSRADRLRSPAGSFDIGLTVETLTTLEHKGQFLAEMVRVLRPGGVLMVADFFYTRESSRHAAGRFRKQVDDSNLVVASEEDWTGNVVAALEAQSPRRLEAINRLPRWTQSAALSFAGTTRSPLYQQLGDGRARYLAFRLERRTEPMSVTS